MVSPEKSISYFQVTPEKYRVVSSLTRAAFLLGRFSSACSAQVLISFNVLNFDQLNIIALISLSLALFISLFLPTVQKSIYFHKNGQESAKFLETFTVEYGDDGHIFARFRKKYVTNTEFESKQRVERGKMHTLWKRPTNRLTFLCGHTIKSPLGLANTNI